MNCDHATRVLDAGLDGELDEATSADLADHVVGCPSCARVQADREALRDALRRVPQYPAPRRLRKAIGDSLTGLERPATIGRTAPPTWTRALAAMGAAASIAFFLGWWTAQPGTTVDERDELIARHVASLAAGGRLYDVASNDRHVVKPWFAGKIDFAPPVRDLSDHGYALRGARLDHLAGQPTAVIVYRIREHDINLFVTRSQMSASVPATVSKARGFAVASWAEGGLSLTAVSDVDPKQLAHFSALMGPAAQ